MIINDINKLSEPFKQKVIAFLTVVRKKYPNVVPFETLRTKDRQKRLYANNKTGGPVARPGTSYHERGLAVDRVFLDEKKNPTRKGDYKFLQLIGQMCGMVPVKGESCHLQDDKRSIVSVMKKNGLDYQVATKTTQGYLKESNDAFRKIGYK